MQIFVKSDVEETFTLEVLSPDPIYCLKNTIQLLVGWPSEQQILEFAGKVLEDECSLADYDIRNKSTLYMFRRSPRGMKIFVKMWTRKIITLEVQYCDTVRNVKTKIQVMERIPLDQQSLMFQGIQLEDEDTLNVYDIHNESNLRLTPASIG